MSNDYRETLRAPLSWWAATAVFALTCGWIVWVAVTVIAGALSAAAVAILAGFGLWRWSGLLIVVDDAGVQVGNALIGHEWLGPAVVLDSAGYRRSLGVDADARAYLATRPWITSGVLVPVNDPNDPAPYWIIGSRDPREVAASLAHHSHGAGRSL